MLIGGWEIDGPTYRDGVYLERGLVSLWTEVQYVTSASIETLLAPGYFDTLCRSLPPLATITVRSFVDDEWQLAVLIVAGNTFDPTEPNLGGQVSVRLVS